MKTQRKKLTHNKAEILLVEDSHTQAEQIRHLLESQYYKVSVTQNGKQAMDWLSKHKPALVISDIVMPEMNGFELCKKIKFNKNTEDIPVILLTRLVDPEEIIEGLSCGADSFITKPYNEEYLLSHIERILSGENVMYNEKVPFSAQILFKGKKRFIQAEQQNIIRLMLDIYEGAIIQNERLVQTQEELRLLNERLESIVEERTSDLSEEIKLSNQIAERLKESEEKWRTLVTTIPEYIGLVDCDGKFLFLNHYAEGFSEKDTIGKSHLDFIPNEWKEFYRLKFEKCINTQKNQIFEYTAFGDNNTLRTYETCLVPIIDHEKVSNVMAIARDITERKLAEEKLLEREEHYRILFDEALDGICLADAETGLIIDCNQALSFLVVRERVELIGQPQTILHPPNTHEAAFSPTFEQHLTDKEGKTLETQIVTSTGIIREVEIKANYMNIRGRKMLQGVFHDITERKRAVEALRESEEKYRRIFENVQDLYYESSMEGIILDLSPSISILSEGQYRREDLIGKSMYEYYSESSERQALLAVLQERGAITDFEITLKNRDGSHIPCSISSKIIFDAQGRPEKIIGSMRNITDRKRAEETIIHERTMLRTLIDNLPDHIYVKDSEGRKVISNIADFKDFGFQSEDQVLGKTDLEILPFPIGRRGYNYEMEVLSSGKSIIGHEEDFIYPDGKKHWSLSTMIPLIDNTGKITGLVGIGHDITERKRAEEELIKAKKKAEESDRLKTAFLHNISHEIRTPMNAIVGFSTLLGEPDVDIQSRQSYIEVIMQSSNHLLSIITDIVDISNIEANLVKTLKSEISVNSTLKSLCNQFMPQANEKKIQLVCETLLSDSDAFVLTDSTKLTQILSNLISNALKFTDKGYIKVGIKLKDSFLEFSVSDTGIGIPEEYHKRIFDRFYQVQNTISKIYEGTGLGLSISKAYVELLGGKIWVSSEPGKGSSFLFTIPYEKQVVETVTVNKTSSPKGFVFPEKKKILVAEDIDSNFKLIQYFLSGTNADILRAVNGKEAVEKCLSAENIDLVLMDIKMPIMDGYTAARLIRETNSKIPIIAQTAFADDRETAIECGCSGFISKPFDKKGLLKVISEFI